MGWLPWLKIGFIFSNGNYGCQVNLTMYKYKYFKFTIMNFSEDDIRIIHVHKKHKCTLCDFRTHKKYNLNVHLRGIHGIPYIKEQSTQIQSGFGSVVTSVTHIPIEQHNEALDLIHKLKALWRNSKKEKENSKEDGENSHAIIIYLENVLNANNIRYNLELA